jgi:ribosome-binding factor A
LNCFLPLAKFKEQMDSRRQLQIASVIQAAFTEILTRDGKGIYGNEFVTLTTVNVTSDLSLARFNLSVLNSQNADAVVQKLNAHKGELKRKLGDKLRHQLRVMPEFEFYRDETLDYVYHIENVFKKIKEDDERIKLEAETPKSTEKKIKAQSPETKEKAVRKKSEVVDQKPEKETKTKKAVATKKKAAAKPKAN